MDPTSTPPGTTPTSADPEEIKKQELALKLEELKAKIVNERKDSLQKIKQIEQENLSFAEQAKKILEEEEQLEKKILEIKKESIGYAETKQQLEDKKQAIDDQIKKVKQLRDAILEMGKVEEGRATATAGQINKQKMLLEEEEKKLASLNEEYSKTSKELDAITNGVDELFKKEDAVTKKATELNKVQKDLNEIIKKGTLSAKAFFDTKGAAGMVVKMGELNELFAKTDEQSKLVQKGLIDAFGGPTLGVINALAHATTQMFSSLIKGGFQVPFIGVQIKGAFEEAKEVIEGGAVAFKAFGYTTEAAETSINNLRSSMAKMGVTEQQLRSGMGELRKNFADIDKQGIAFQQTMLKDVSALQAMGFATDQTTKAFSKMVLGMSLTEAEAEKEMVAIAKLGQTLGQGTKTLSDFVALAPKLEAFGNKAPDIFMKTAAAAQKLGVDTATLYDKMSQYDSFEKAADAAGELNLVLGGQFIDSLELMRASIEGGPVETMNLLNKGMRAANLEVDKMTPSMLRAAAAAAGMGDNIQLFKQVAKFNPSEMDAYVKKQEEMAKKQEEITKTAEFARDMFQDLQYAFSSIFKDPGVVNTMKIIVSTFTAMFKVVGFLVEMLSSKYFPVLQGIAAIMAVMAAGGFIKFLITSISTFGKFTVSLLNNAAALRTRNAVAAQGAVVDTQAAGATARDTAATGLNTAGKAANTAAENLGIMARLRSIPAKIASMNATARETIVNWAGAGSNLAKAASIPFIGPAVVALGIAAIVAALGFAASKAGGGIGSTAGGTPALPTAAIPKTGVGPNKPKEESGGESKEGGAEVKAEDGTISPSSVGSVKITTPSGKSMKTSGGDEVVALKEGGILATKLDNLVKLMEQTNVLLNQIAVKEQVVKMDGRRVNEALAESNRYNPYNQV